MEEDLNENELEERFYSMRHNGNETAVLTTNLKDDHFVVRRPPSNLHRYWHSNDDQATAKVIRAKQSNLNEPLIPENLKAKGEKGNVTSTLPADLSIFQSPVPQYIKKSIEIIENDGPTNVVELQSSDEDEVIEVKLPPKPTITIESSDEDEIAEVSNTNGGDDKDANKITPDNKKTTNRSDREVSASPVPSIVSSVSDEFIRGDCIALNISSKHPNKQSFDFSLHGSDIIDQSATPKRKKKKKNKDTTTSTPITNTPAPITPVPKDGEYFATPKSKAKNKRQKTKNYSVSEKSIPNADVYDSDSNQSINGVDKNNISYSFIDRSFPHSDVYESDSNPSEKTSPAKKSQKDTEENICSTSDDNVSLETHTEQDKIPVKSIENDETEHCLPTIDLTETTFDDTVIDENIVMANVTGFQEELENAEQVVTIRNDATKFGSTKVPAILYEDLDFDNLKGKEKVCKKRKYSLSTLRAEMEKFYNESWGGENFNHREIQKNMSRDKSLWVIDPKDRMPGLARRKPTCNFCNRTGHRDDTCRFKPPVCHMCGHTGHYETRCPRKICVNCGSPNHMYTTMCRNCSNWNNIRCAECGQIGHPASHCPDLWRRYHNTITCNTPLEENRQFKKHYQLFCSGCARRGHLIHTCRVSLPFSGLPINSPYVSLYNPVWCDNNKQIDNNSPQRNRPVVRYFTQDSSSPSEAVSNKNDKNKRQSNSPVCHEGHTNKKRHMSNCEEVDTSRNTKNPMSSNTSGRKTPQNKDQCEDTTKVAKDPSKVINDNAETPKTSNAVVEQSDSPSITSSNHDKRGQIIQDNEVSDTSDVITSARIYITNEIMEKIKTKEGEEWLKKYTQSNNITVQKSDSNTFISILGKVGDQEAFQSTLREWIQSQENSDKVKPSNDINTKEENDSDNGLCANIPRNRYNVLRKISKALDSLNEDLGDPKDIYNELTFLQKHHQQLLKQKQISPKQLSNNRDNMNDVIKKLNMVLIGQAGLANGSKHLRELRSLKYKLTNFRQKYLPTQMRREIGEHYRCVFTALPREDYQDLLNKYYTLKSKLVSFKKKKNDKSMKLDPTIVRKKLSRCWQKMNNKVEINEGDQGNAKKPLDQTMNKLVFYHRRLMCAKAHDNVLDKTRVKLVNKLSSHISSLGQDNVSPKSLRKMKKRMRITQEQAQLFLTNV